MFSLQGALNHPRKRQESQITRTFGVEWEARDMGRDRNQAWAISTVPEELV